MRTERVLQRIYVAVPVTFALWTVALLAVGWPSWWRYLAPEESPMTWLQSVVLALCCALAGLVAAQCWILDRPMSPYLLIGAGFGWLALDERFTIHERVRDQILAPRGIRAPLLTWVGPGDFILLGYAVVGLFVLWRVVPVLREVPRARALFLAGVVCAAAAVGADSVDPSRYTLTGERVEQTLEEVVELTSGVLFLLATLTVHMRLAAGNRPE
jgi:hypothetical protein